MKLNFSYHHNFVELWNKLYEKYDEGIFKIDGISEEDLDIVKFSKRFFESDNTANGSVDPNSNVSNKNIISYNTELSKPLTKLNSYYLLWLKIKNEFSLDTADEVIESIISGDIYFHDSTNVNLFYCFNYTAYDIVINGVPDWMGATKTYPPRKLNAFKGQIENFLTNVSRMQMGATGIADLLIFWAWYIQRIFEGYSSEDGMFERNKFRDNKAFEESVYNYSKTLLTSFVYNMNFNHRGEQTLFTNISIYDDYFLEDYLKDISFTEEPSKINKDIVKKIQDQYINVMNDELERTPLTYPVTTVMFNKDENNEIKDKKFAKYIAEKNINKMWMNMFNGESGVIASCCRLKNDVKSIENEFTNSFGGGSSKIGSSGVFTINLPRVSKKYDNDVDIKEKIKRLTSLTIIGNYARRMIIKDRVDQGLYPLYDEGFVNFKKQFCTTGILGGYEFLKNLGKDIQNKSGIKYLQSVLKIINDTQKSYHEYENFENIPFNIEQVPGESACVKLAKKDEILGYNDDGIKLYSNQFVPLQQTANMFERVKTNGELDSEFSGGSVCHLNMDQKLKSVDDLYNLILSICKTGTIYWATNYNLMYCNDCNSFLVFEKNENVCQNCESENVEKYERVVGFLTPVSSWSETRQKYDYEKRQHYKNNNIKK